MWFNINIISSGVLFYFFFCSVFVDCFDTLLSISSSLSSLLSLFSFICFFFHSCFKTKRPSNLCGCCCDERTGITRIYTWYIAIGLNASRNQTDLIFDGFRSFRGSCVRQICLHRISQNQNREKNCFLMSNFDPL